LIPRRSYACAPAPLSSIFSPKIRGESVEEIGARGGGFTLAGAIETRVEHYPGGEDQIQVYVNGVMSDHATSLTAAEISRNTLRLQGRVVLRHSVSVPIGAGLGTSASIALTTILALFRIAGRGILLISACRLVHEIEVRCGTGLNSEAGFLSSGLVLVLEAGAPPRLRVDSIPLPRDSALIVIAASPLEKSKTLSRRGLDSVEEIGDRKIGEILENPTPENFLEKSREFALEAGFATERVQEIFEELGRLPVIGYAQNMIGEACHALALRRDAEAVAERLREVFPEYFVRVFEIGSSISSFTEA
jgi:pantoate kinase